MSNEVKDNFTGRRECWRVENLKEEMKQGKDVK